MADLCCQPGNVHTKYFELNPADVASRGTSPNELIHDTQWWHGPAFLQEPDAQWPEWIQKEEMHLEARQSIQTHHVQLEENETLKMIFEHWPNWTRAVRIVAFCRRVKHRQESPLLNIEEIRNAENTVFQSIQKTHFNEDYERLRDNNELDKKSKLL